MGISTAAESVSGSANTSSRVERRAARMSFAEERRTFEQAIDAEQRARHRAVEESESRAGLQAQGFESEIQDLGRQVQYLQTELESEKRGE